MKNDSNNQKEEIKDETPSSKAEGKRKFTKPSVHRKKEIEKAVYKEGLRRNEL